MAVASLTIAAYGGQGDLLYGPYIETWNDSAHHNLGTHQARHLTAAGREYQAKLRAAGFSEETINLILRGACAKDNRVPADPEPKAVTATLDSNQRVIAHGTMAAVGEASLKVLASGLLLDGVGKPAQGDAIIHGLMLAGAAIDINPGDIVTLSGGSVSVPGTDYSALNITFHGLPYLMIVTEETFK